MLVEGIWSNGMSDCLSAGTYLWLILERRSICRRMMMHVYKHNDRSFFSWMRNLSRVTSTILCFFLSIKQPILREIKEWWCMFYNHNDRSYVLYEKLFARDFYSEWKGISDYLLLLLVCSWIFTYGNHRDDGDDWMHQILKWEHWSPIEVHYTMNWKPV